MKKSYFYAGCAILCWSTVAATCKALLAELNNMQLLWMNSMIAALFLLVYNVISGNFRKNKAYKLKDYLIMAAIGIPGSLLYYMFYYAGTDILPASQAFIINYLWPIMSVIFACIILKERMTFRKLIAILVSFVGVAVVIGTDISGFSGEMLAGTVLCILGAVSYGVFTALNQKADYDKPLSVTVSYIATFIITTVINAFSGDLFVPKLNQMPGFLWNGIFTVAIANTIWILALKNGKTAKISNLAYITPFLSLVWTALFLKEPITANSFLGLVIIIAGIFIQLGDKAAVPAENQK